MKDLMRKLALSAFESKIPNDNDNVVYSPEELDAAIDAFAPETSKERSEGTLNARDTAQRAKSLFMQVAKFATEGDTLHRPGNVPGHTSLSTEKALDVQKSVDLAFSSIDATYRGY